MVWASRSFVGVGRMAFVMPTTRGSAVLPSILIKEFSIRY